MQEYVDLKHMKKVNNEELNNSYIIPYRAVVRSSSTTMKLRVVFNASSYNKSGLSLNTILLRGPKGQCKLVDKLMKFRLNLCF